MKKSLVLAICCLLMAAGIISCSGSSPEAVAEKAMECLKNGDADGYSQMMQNPNPNRVRHIIKVLDYKHKGIVDYKLKSVEKVDYPDGSYIYWVKMEISDGKNGKGSGYIFVIKDESGKLVLQGDGTSDWYEYRF